MQVTYVNFENPDVVLTHGLTSGTSAPLADMGKEEFVLQIFGRSSDLVESLAFKTNTNVVKEIGTLFANGTPNIVQINNPIFGFFGGTKNGLLVSLGFYVLDNYKPIAGNKK